MSPPICGASPTDELDELAGEIRDFIVSAVSDNAGHLGSNLGAVELTLALHRVFESPTDAILWDTGHQAYIHKIVTGRQAGFEQLRKRVGCRAIRAGRSRSTTTSRTAMRRRYSRTPTAWPWPAISAPTPTATSSP